MNRRKTAKEKNSRSKTGAVVVWLVATAILIGALTTVIVLLNRNEDVPPSGAPEQKLVEMANFEDALRTMKDSGRVSFFDSYDDKKRLDADAEAFALEYTLTRAAFAKNDAGEEVCVYELKSEADAEAFLEWVKSSLAVGRQAVRGGRVVAWGTDALLSELLDALRLEARLN